MSESTEKLQEIKEHVDRHRDHYHLRQSVTSLLKKVYQKTQLRKSPEKEIGRKRSL
jgi:hypothetical protein